MPIPSHRGVHARPTDPTRVLEEIKRLVLEQLGGLPGEFYGPIETALSTTVLSGEEARSPQVLYQSQAALWVLRQHHAAHVMRYRQQIAQGFDDFRSLRIRHSGDLPLGLIDESQIDFHLAGQSLATTLEQRYNVQLEVMDARLAILAAALGAEPALNPLGASRLATAFVETFRDEQIPEILRRLLFEHYEKALSRVLAELYEKANALLLSAGYGVPASRRSTAPIPSRPSAPAGFGDAATGVVDGQGFAGADYGGGSGSGHGVGGYDSGGAGQGGHGQNGHGQGGHSRGGHATGGPSHGNAHPGAGPGADVPTSAELGELRSLLHAWREGGLGNEAATGSRSIKAAPGQRRELRLEELVSVASLLQSEPADVFARALAGSGTLAGVIREQLNDGSRRLGLDPEHTRLSLEDEDAIDLVGLLFDSLFSSQQLQERARRLYARLVLPFVKVALTDQQLFVQPAHPARRLFDSITEAVAGNRGETPQERELLDRAASISQRVVAEYNEDLTIFETAHRELDALLHQQRRRIELQAERAAKATNGRERLNYAREQADAVLARRLAAPPLSPAIAEFLSTSWRHHLVQTWLRDGSDSERFAQAISLGDGLVEADRIAAAGRGNDLANHLLALEPMIGACLASSGLDQNAAEHGLAILVKGLVYPNTPRDLHPLPPRHAEEDAEERGLWLDATADSLRLDPADLEHLGSLPIGAWLQVTDVRGESMAVKIAWVSPLTERRLLVNRRGLRVLVASVEELAALAAGGRLQMGAEPTAFEQAMRHVRQQLDLAAAKR
ncbi:MAG TPA: DUF1631 family protein [Lysobacter sp.]|nr:DUF1631 family protein [Lysobacter sp.]